MMSSVSHTPVFDETTTRSGEGSGESLAPVLNDPLEDDDPTLELVVRGQAGNREAIEALFERCLPSLEKWAHGRLPPVARGHLDAGDIVQDAALQFYKRLEFFEPRRAGAVHAYLKRSVVNRIRDEIRRLGRQGKPTGLAEDPPDGRTSPLDDAIEAENHRRFHRALDRLQPVQRGLIIGRMELDWSYAEIAHRFDKPSADAARMAVTRVLKQLSNELARDASQDQLH